VDSTLGASPNRVIPAHVEFSLLYLIQRSGDSLPRADNRLSGFENAIATLASRWRPARPLSPARELRMADETREALLAWVEDGGATAGHTIERLGVYASGAVTDDSVPEGWVRLQLSTRREAR
jgi:hypothetical protein